PRKPPSPDRAWNTSLPAAQGDAQSWISDLARQTDAHSSFNKHLDTPIDIDTLTPDLLAGPTYELMRGSYYGHIKWIEDLVHREMWIQQQIDYNKHALWGVSYWGRKRK
nr:hypothetical protein [Tanacetum cinerariifolium]